MSTKQITTWSEYGSAVDEIFLVSRVCLQTSSLGVFLRSKRSAQTRIAALQHFVRNNPENIFKMAVQHTENLQIYSSTFDDKILHLITQSTNT
jgi:hypothetical protein